MIEFISRIDVNQAILSLFLANGRLNFLVNVESYGVGKVGSNKAGGQSSKETLPTVTLVNVVDAATETAIQSGSSFVGGIELQPRLDDVLWVADKPTEHSCQSSRDGYLWNR